jgi:hypothetical protein
VKFGPKISIITIKTNEHKTSNKFATNTSTSLQADCCLIWMSVANGLILRPFATTNEDGCCWLLCLGAWPAAVCFEHAPQLQNNIVVSLPSPSPQNSWLLHPPVDPRPLDYLLNQLEQVWGQLFDSSPLPSTSCAEEQLEPAIAPSSCCRGGCFISPTAKLMASRATEAREGIGDGVGWLSSPSSDDLEAIGHGFGGRSTDRWVDCCVLCLVVREKVRYFCMYLTKKIH